MHRQVTVRGASFLPSRERRLTLTHCPLRMWQCLQFNDSQLTVANFAVECAFTRDDLFPIFGLL